MSGAREGVVAESKSSLVEDYGAKVWNVFNESKSFVTVSLLGSLPLFWWAWGVDVGAAGLVATLVAGILAWVLLWWDYPLSLRGLLWLGALGFGFRYAQIFGMSALWLPIGLCLAWFCFFNFFVWGFVYYHFFTRESWATTFKFPYLVMTNDDSTAGNFFQVVPQLLAPAFAWRILAGDGTAMPASDAYLSFGGGTALLLGLAIALHGAWAKRKGIHDVPEPRALVPEARARRVIFLVIDGCRADRCRNPKDAQTPWLDHLAKSGVEVKGVRTMYPARTSVSFSSMMTGALPRVHGVTSNFALRPVRVPTLFDALEREGKRGVLIGIAHHHDIAHKNWNVHSVTSFVRNEDADELFFKVTRQVIEAEDPDFLVVDLISVDQTGHMRGSLGADYRRAIEATDAQIRKFCEWLESRRFFDDGVLFVTSDHGQGRGIGGHGYWGRGEVEVPFLVYGPGAGVPQGSIVLERRTVMDVAPTVAAILLKTPWPQAIRS